MKSGQLEWWELPGEKHKTILNPTRLIKCERTVGHTHTILVTLLIHETCSRLYVILTLPPMISYWTRPHFIAHKLDSLRLFRLCSTAVLFKADIKMDQKFKRWGSCVVKVRKRARRGGISGGSSWWWWPNRHYPICYSRRQCYADGCP